MQRLEECVQYWGDPAVTATCQAAVTRLLQHGDRITKAVVLTYHAEHALLLHLDPYEVIAVRSGFASGYPGEGPRRFSYVLELLDANGAEIRECAVNKALMARLDRCALTSDDMRLVRESSQLTKWRRYAQMGHALAHDSGELWQLEQHPLVVPFGLIDPRLADLVVDFWGNPDDRLSKAFRRLESVIRDRTGCSEHGSKLLRRVFLENPPLLAWNGLDASEQSSRGQLFTATFGAFRNPRAHRELPDNRHLQLAELLAVNQLYLLEAQSAPPDGGSNGA